MNLSRDGKVGRVVQARPRSAEKNAGRADYSNSLAHLGPSRITRRARRADPLDSHNLKMYIFFMHPYIFFMQPHISHSKNFSNNILLHMSHENNIMILFTQCI